MIKKEIRFIGSMLVFCVLVSSAIASEATSTVSKDELKRTVGMSKQEIKKKYGPPDGARDGAIGMMWVYFDLYDPDTEKSNHYNNCSLFFDANENVDHVNC